VSDHDPTEVVRELYDAFEVGDHERIRRCLADGLRWQQAASAVPAAGVPTVGADAILDGVIRPLERDGEGFTEQIEQMVAAPGHVTVTGTYQGTHRATGRTLEAEFCHLWTVEDGQITGFRQFTDTAAFAAATAAGDG
jgi:uncharacterized protein